MKQEITKERLRHTLNHTSVPDVAEGWAVMQTLLEAEAAGRRLYVPVLLRRVAVAASLLLLVGISGWWLLNRAPDPLEAVTKLSVIRPPAQEEITRPPMVSASPDRIRPQQTSESGVPSSVTGTPGPAVVATATSLSARASLSPLAAHLVAAFPKMHFVVLDEVVEPLKIVRSDRGAMFPPATLSSRAAAAALPAQVTQETVDRPWHIGLQLNANGGSSFGPAGQNFNPVLKGTPVDVYPSISVSKKISERVGIQAGLAVVSPVEIAGDHFQRSVPNTDRNRVAMAATTADEFQISRLYYVDVPVTMQYHIGKRFTVGSGLQLSVLQKVIGKQRRVDYAADYTVMYAAPEQPTAENLTGNKSAEAGIKPLDLRWLGTFKYQLADRWTAALRLQYGLLDVSDNAAFLYNHRDHNTVVSAGIGFLIK